MYSPKHNIFFIHIPKCAGSSIDVTLFAENGIYVPHGEKIKNFISKSDRDKFYFFGKGRDAHATPDELAGQKEFELSTYKFAIVRNPWDRFVSEYYWRKRQPNFTNISVSDLVDSYKHKGKRKEYAHTHFIPQWKFVYNDNKRTLKIDEFYKLETDMPKLLTMLRKKTNNTNLIIPKRNQSPTRKDYQSFFDKETKSKLLPIFKNDLELFGYEF